MRQPIMTAWSSAGLTPATTSARSWLWPRSIPSMPWRVPSPTGSPSRPSAPSTSPTSWRPAAGRCRNLDHYNSPVATICSTSTSLPRTSTSTRQTIMTPTDLTRLDAQLQRLHLHYIQSHYQALATRAAEQQRSHLDYLEQLVEGEATMRENRSIERRIRNARFPVVKSLDDFQWSWPKKINRPQIQNLFRLAFIATHTNVVLIGNVGLGKTHLSIALGRAACLNGHSVLFPPAVDIINPLAAAQSAGKLKREFQRYLKPAVLIVDEVGYLPIDKHGADFLFQIISQRYERAPMVITTNRAYKHWAQIFNNDSTLTSAILDRVLHHAETVIIEGKSFRMKDEIEE